MALRVWLPLNGNLENKGISSLSLDSTAFSVENNGKIGKCIKTTASSSIDLGYNGNQINNGDLSFGGWFKISESDISSIISSGNYTSTNKAATSNLIGNDSYGGIGLIWATNNIYNSTFSSMTIFGTLRTGTVNQSTASITVPFDQWMHLFLTFQKSTGILSFYKDGILIGNKVFSNFTDAVSRNLMLNYKAVYGGNAVSFNLPYYVNDIRIYDHCLSQKEIKEISQGLVLHYKLDRLEQSSDNFITGILPGGQTTINNLIVTTSGENKDTYFRLQLKEALEEGKTYKISCIGENIPEGYYWRFPIGAQSNSTLPFLIYNGYNEYTFIANEACTTNPLMMDDSYRVGVYENQCIFKDFQLYECEKIKDSSGYENDGIMIGNLETETNNDDGRYQISTKFPTNTAHIQLPIINYSNFGTSYTFTWWEYLTTTSGGPMPWGFSDGNRLNFYHTTNLCWNTGDGGSNPFVPNKKSTTLVDNKWHFIAISGDGTDVNLYIDNDYVGKATTWKPLTGTQLWISGWANATNYTMVNSKMSDFRIYATALSAEDILTLYHTPLQIDNMQNMHGFEFTENKTKQSIGQNGQIMNNSLTKTYLVNNFNETNIITDWTFTSPTISNGIVTTTGTAPTINSKTFIVNPDDIIVVKFTLSMPTPSTSTSGQGLYLGTQASTNTNRYNFNFTTKTWGTAQSNASSSWNTYFLSGYNSTDTVTIQSYILGSNIDINNVPAAYCSLSSIGSTNAIQLTSGTTTYIRAGYNSGNSTMVIKLYDFEIYNLKENGFCEIDNVHIGKGFYQANNFIEK